MSEVIPAWVDGALTPVEKMEVHLQGLRHEAVSVFVTRSSSVLIQLRALGKYHTPGLWANACCTHPRWGEAAEACAQRRLSEELGISGLSLVWRDRLEYRAAVGAAMIEHEVVDIFVAEAPSTLRLAPDASEVEATRWIDVRDLTKEVEATPERFTPWLRIYLERSRERIFGSAAA